MPTQATIAITPGAGQFLDAVSLVIGAQTVVRETMVIADPTNPTSLAGVTVGGALQVDGSATIQPVSIGSPVTVSQATAASLNATVVFPSAQHVIIDSGTIAANNNITQWNSISLGSPSAYGTGPGAVNVIGVNAFITNTVPISGTIAATQSGTWTVGISAAQTIAVTNAGTFAVQATLAAETTKVIGTVNQGTSPWVVSCPTDIEVVQDTAADLNATVVGTGTFVVQASITTLGQQLAAASVPVVLTAAQINTLTPLTTVAVTQSTSPWIVASNLTHNGAAPSTANLGVLPALANASAPTFTEGRQVLLSTDLSGNLRTTGTFTGTITGSVTGTLTNNNAAPSTNNLGVLGFLANAADPTFTEGDLVTGSATLSGYQRVILHAETTKVIGTINIAASQTVAVTNTGTFAVQATLSAETTKVIGTVNQGTSPWVVSNGGTFAVQAAGTLTNNNAAPSTNNIGALMILANAAAPTWTEGDLVLGSADLAGFLRTNVGKWAGTTLGAPSNFGTTPGAVAVPGVNSNLFIAGSAAINTGVTGEQKVGIAGAAGGTLDTTTAAATTPLNGLATLVGYIQAAPTPTTGQSVGTQADWNGSTFVKPIRRSQTVAQATTITNSSATTTILAADGTAGVFRDISNLMITVTPAATTDLAFTATLSDGTNSYIFDMDTGALATATADPTIINLSFNPPLPATSSATLWSLTLSINTVTVHVTVVAVRQKAS
jgi:hypothetical protein